MQLLHARIRDFLSQFLKESRLMFSVCALPTHSDHWTKKRQFYSRRQETRSFKFPSKQGRNEDTATPASEEKKPTQTQHLAAPVASVAHQRLSTVTVTSLLTHAMPAGWAAVLGWIWSSFSFLGKGYKVPNISCIKADPQTTPLMGFCLVIQGDSPI